MPPQRKETMEIAAEISAVLDDTAFSVSKLNLPSSAGAEEEMLINQSRTEGSKGGLEKTSSLNMPEERKDTDSNNSNSHRPVFSRLEGSLVPRIENPVTTEEDSQS